MAAVGLCKGLLQPAHGFVQCFCDWGLVLQGTTRSICRSPESTGHSTGKLHCEARQTPSSLVQPYALLMLTFSRTSLPEVALQQDWLVSEELQFSQRPTHSAPRFGLTGTARQFQSWNIPFKLTSNKWSSFLLCTSFCKGIAACTLCPGNNPKEDARSDNLRMVLTGSMQLVPLEDSNGPTDLCCWEA